MANLTAPKPQLNSHLRVVRDEDAPPYDAVPSPKMAGGFAMIPARVFDLNDGTALAVFAVLAKHANQEGACWPSMKRLEECLGWTDNRIRPALKLLIDSGIVAIEKRKLNGMDQSNLYRIIPEVQVSRDRTPVSRSGSMGIPSEGVGYPATGHEQEPIELKENDIYTAKSSRPNYTPEFENFWRLYPRGHGVKTLAFKEWKKLNSDEQRSVILALADWVASEKWGNGFIREAQRWLQYREWEQAAPPRKRDSQYNDAGQWVPSHV